MESEKETTTSATTTSTLTLTLGPFLRPLGLILRIVALVLATIVLILSGATIGIIQSNEYLRNVLLHGATSSGPGPFQELFALIANTHGTAVWLLILAIAVIIAEAVALILIAMKVQTGRLVLDILEIIFSIIFGICYFSTAIACATYASAWGEPPVLCEQLPNSNTEQDCNEGALTATNSLQATCLFIQLAIVVPIIILIIYNIIQKRKT